MVQYRNPQKYRVEYLVTVKSAGFNTTELRVYQPRPIEWASQKEIQIEEVSPPPTSSGADPTYGNGIFYWNLSGTPQGGATAPFKIQFTFTLYWFWGSGDGKTMSIERTRWSVTKLP